MRSFITLVENAVSLFERATRKGASKFIGTRTQNVYYISHIIDGNMVQCRAHVAATSPRQPLREKIAVASCVMEPDKGGGIRNNIPVFSAKSVVDERCRRDGLLGAMYDHLDNHGFVVYPADGSVGVRLLQAQSDEARAFWAARKSNRTPSTLLPVSEDELYGWKEFNIFAHATEIGGHPVLGEVKISGCANPMLVLWKKEYAKFTAQVGVIFGERGYRLIVKIGEEDFCPWYESSTRSFRLASYETRMAKYLVGGIEKACLMVGEILENI